MLAGAWVALAPVYAHLFATVGQALVPVLEPDPGTTYRVEGATIWTVRSYVDPATRQLVRFRGELWKGYSSYSLILLAALILATPGWSLRQRCRLLAIGCGLLTLIELAFFLSTVEYVRFRQAATRTGSVLFPPGYSRWKEVLSTWVYYFFQTMGRGLFPLLLYSCIIGAAWGQVDKPASRGVPRPAAGRNAPCPCGSGKKYKRCCEMR